MFSEDLFFCRHKILAALLLLLVLLAATPAVFLWHLAQGPYHDYFLDIMIPSPNDKTPAGGLQAGVAIRDITPNLDLKDSWKDVNGNNKYDEDVDTFVDKNGNDKFDGVWIAGFDTNRPAKEVHDPIWCRALALRNNGVTLVMVTFDSIGIFHNYFVKIRKMLNPALNISHVMFSSTHCHEVPDTMGNWSYAFRVHFRGEEIDVPIFGFDEEYMDLVCRSAKEAVEEAVQKLQPADMYCAKVQAGPEGFVRDSRKPDVLDPNLYLLRFTEQNSDKTIATFVNWGNHPESLGGNNSRITSDFCHYLREGIERGVPAPNGAQGFGGICLYFQGMVGGLMTQLDVTVPDRDGQHSYEDSSFDKAAALGLNTAIVACNALRGPQVWKNENPRLAVAAKTFFAPMEGMLKWAVRLGLLHQGYYGHGRAKTEVNVIRIGEVCILTAPGELYPEVVQGGVEARAGRDFDVLPQEVPPLREEMEKNASMAFVIGLANDEIGYMIPKSQWDAMPPWTYGDEDQYGEENSGGPDVTTTYHQVALDLLKKMNVASR